MSLWSEQRPLGSIFLPGNEAICDQQLMLIFKALTPKTQLSYILHVNHRLWIFFFMAEDRKWNFLTSRTSPVFGDSKKQSFPVSQRRPKSPIFIRRYKWLFLGKISSCILLVWLIGQSFWTARQITQTCTDGFEASGAEGQSFCSCLWFLPELKPVHTNNNTETLSRQWRNSSCSHKMIHLEVERAELWSNSSAGSV